MYLGENVKIPEAPRRAYCVTNEELAGFRRLLEEQKAEYLETLSSSLESGKGEELDQQRVGRLSRMDALQQQSIVQAANRRIEGELRQIELAMERIERGTYGKCITCGGAIQIGRLEAFPSTTACIDCARRNG